MKPLVRIIFRWLARLILRRYHPTIVAIAGSVGKTGTKDAIAAALASPARSVRKTPGNFNAEIGVPATILSGAPAPTGLMGWLQILWQGKRTALFGGDYPAAVVLELAADHPGDLQPLLDLVRPKVGVLTSAAPEHLEFFGNEEGVVEEESLVVRTLPAEATAVVNIDDPRIADIVPQLSARVVSYGWSSSARVRADHLQLMNDARGLPSGMVVHVVIDDQPYAVTLPGVLGRHQAYAVLAALAVAVALGDAPSDVLLRLSSFAPPAGRMRLFPGVHGSLLIDDSYNASPEAVQAALRTLSELTVPGQRVAILGQMSELGAAAAEWHDRIGRELVHLRVDRLITVGPLAERIGTSAVAAGLAADRVTNVPTAEAAAAHIQGDLNSGDVVLLKGSRFASRLEKAVAILLENPERDTSYLVHGH